MAKTSELCPRCHAPVPALRTASVPAMPDDAYRGMPLRLTRYQDRVCPSCGMVGSTAVFVSRTRWLDPSTGREFCTSAQDCAVLAQT